MASLLPGWGIFNLDYAALALPSIALPWASQRAKFAGKGPETGKNARIETDLLDSVEGFEAKFSDLGRQAAESQVFRILLTIGEPPLDEVFH